MSKLQPFRVYNPEHPNLPTKIFGGKASGIRDYDNIKYPILLQYNKDLFGEYWIEDEVKLGKDIEEYKNKLTESERKVFNYVTGSLNWLDSIASDFNAVLLLATSDPSLRSVIALILSFEVLHNRSYQYLTSTMLNDLEKKEAFEKVRHLPLLVERNNLIIPKIDKMIKVFAEYILSSMLGKPKEIDDYFLQTAFEGIIAYQALEGLFFSGGFVYFHSLARDNKMLESNSLINMIKTDENQHSEIFGLIVQMLMSEFPQLNTQENMDYAMNFFRQCVEAEKKWSAWLFKDIDTLSIKEYHDYVEYLANLLCRNAGMNEPYPENKELKSRWIATYGSKKRSKDKDQIVSRTDFLQANSINYTHEGGEDFDL
ncbi:ribonucleotide-diphosphate reductase subunit beta [Bacillus smithii]|uniref:ribonucleotide-diphosphate reductase subunit beta n=1 Tax=Bacillus smithii TaxID=1479 RepID=UPI003D1947E0